MPNVHMFLTILWIGSWENYSVFWLIYKTLVLAFPTDQTREVLNYNSILSLLCCVLSHLPTLSPTSLFRYRTFHMCTKFQLFNLSWDPPCLLHWRCCRANACYLWSYLIPVSSGLRGQSLLKLNNCPCPLQPLLLEMATSMCHISCDFYLN